MAAMGVCLFCQLLYDYQRKDEYKRWYPLSTNVIVTLALVWASWAAEGEVLKPLGPTQMMLHRSLEADPPILKCHTRQPHNETYLAQQQKQKNKS
jgi:hypothetical protein